MARLTVDYFSDALGMATSMTVLLPEATAEQIGAGGVARAPGTAPVLYLLHGHSDDHSAWTRRSNLERYAEQYGLAVVMPSAHRSFYADEVGGLRHWTHLSEELPQKVASFFAVSTAREDTFVAGLSMGGYGAMKWALRAPARFAAAASLSGALDVHALNPLRYAEPGAPSRLEQIWGSHGPGPDDDLIALVARAGGDLPRLLVRCGHDDPLLPMNERFAEALTTQGVVADVAWTPGDHTWEFWDTHIQDVLAWLPLRGRA